MRIINWKLYMISVIFIHSSTRYAENFSIQPRWKIIFSFLILIYSYFWKIKESREMMCNIRLKDEYTK